MKKLNLIAGALLAVAAFGAQAGVIVDRSDVPGSQTVIDFNGIGGEVVNAGNYNIGSAVFSADQSFVLGETMGYDLAENGLWGAGKEFLAFNYAGPMTLNLSFNGQTTQGVAFDYNIYDTDSDGSAFLKVSYFDSSNALIKSTKFTYSPFGASTYNEFQSFGFVSNSANIARVSITGDGVVLDNLTYTQPVPEPETYAMLLAGLGLMGTMARRRTIQK